MRFVLFLLAALLARPAMSLPQRPSDDDRRSLEAVINEINAIRAQDDRIGQGPIKDVAYKVGLRNRDGKLLRPSLPDPAYSNLSDGDLAKAMKEIRDFDKEVAAAFSSLPAAVRERFDIATTEHKKNQEKLKPLCDKAIKLALKAYHIEPTGTSRTIVNGPPPPRTADDFPSYWGKEAPWPPVYREGQNPKVLGFTDPNGKSGISRIEVFDYADRLGFILYHESQHFDDLLDASQQVKNQPEVEVRHRTQEKSLIGKGPGKVFALHQDDIDDNEAKISDYRVEANKWNVLMQEGFDPWKKSQAGRFLKGYRPGENFESDASTIVRIVSSEIEDGDFGDKLERLREDRAKDFVDAYAGETQSVAVAARERVAIEAQTRKEDEERARRQRQAELDRQAEQRRLDENRRRSEIEEQARQMQAQAQSRANAARACGFEELPRQWGRGAMSGFQATHGYQPFYYYYDFTPSNEAARVAFMLGRACIEQTGGSSLTLNGNVNDPCDDGLEIMQRRWDSPGFRNALVLGTHQSWSHEPDAYLNGATYCVDYVVATVRSPVNWDKIRASMQEMRRRAVESRDKDLRRPLPSPPHESGGGNWRDNRDSRGGGRSDGCPPGTHFISDGLCGREADHL